MPIGIPRPFTPPMATSSLVERGVLRVSPNFSRIDHVLSHHHINPQMVYAVKYLCIKYSLQFIDYIDSGFFGSVFMVGQNGYVFALKVALPMEGWLHSPAEPILTMLSSLPPSQITGRPLCYFASHETVDYPDGDDGAGSVGIDDINDVLNCDKCFFSKSNSQSLESPKIPSQQPQQPKLPKPRTIPLFISSTLLSYVPGLDLGNFTELRLKGDYAALIKEQKARGWQEGSQNNNYYFENDSKIQGFYSGSQKDYCFENYSKISFFSTKTIQLITAQLLLVTLSCHKKGIVHRDIKPSNILLVPQKYETDSVGNSIQGDVSNHQIQNHENKFKNKLKNNFENNFVKNENFDHESLQTNNNNTPPSPHQTLLKKIKSQISSTFLNNHSNHNDDKIPFFFPMINLLDFGIGSLPVTPDHLSTFANLEEEVFRSVVDMITCSPRDGDCVYDQNGQNGQNGLNNGQNGLNNGLNVQNRSETIQSTQNPQKNLHYDIDFELLKQYQTNDARVCSLDLFALALTVLELLLGYIPGSKTTSQMIQDGVFDVLTQQYYYYGQEEEGNEGSDETEKDEKNQDPDGENDNEKDAIPLSNTTIQNQHQERNKISPKSPINSGPLFLTPLSQQLPIPTKQRELHKFVRKGRMDAILIEFEHYHSDLSSRTSTMMNNHNDNDVVNGNREKKNQNDQNDQNDENDENEKNDQNDENGQSFQNERKSDQTSPKSRQTPYKRHFTPEMIQTFNLLLSPCPLDRYKAIFSPWIQSVLPLVLEQLDLTKKNEKLQQKRQENEKISRQRQVNFEENCNSFGHNFDNFDNFGQNFDNFDHFDENSFTFEPLALNTLLPPPPIPPPSTPTHFQVDKDPFNGRYERGCCGLDINSGDANDDEHGNDDYADTLSTPLTSQSTNNNSNNNTHNNSFNHSNVSQLSDPLDHHFDLNYQHFVINSSQFTTNEDFILQKDQEVIKIDEKSSLQGNGLILAKKQPRLKREELILTKKQLQILNNLMNQSQNIPKHILDESIIGSLQQTIIAITLFQYMAARREKMDQLSKDITPIQSQQSSQTLLQTQTLQQLSQSQQKLSHSQKLSQLSHPQQSLQLSHPQQSLQLSHPQKLSQLSHPQQSLQHPLVPFSISLDIDPTIPLGIDIDGDIDHDNSNHHNSNHDNSNHNNKITPLLKKRPITPSKHLQFTVYNPFYLATIPSHLFSPTQPQTVLSFIPQPLRRSSRIFQSGELTSQSGELMRGSYCGGANRSFNSGNVTKNKDVYGFKNNIDVNNNNSNNNNSNLVDNIYCNNHNNIIKNDHHILGGDDHLVDLVYDISAHINDESLAKKTISFLLGTVDRAPANSDVPQRYELP